MFYLVSCQIFFCSFDEEANSMEKKKCLHPELAEQYKFICQESLLTISIQKSRQNIWLPCTSSGSEFQKMAMRTWSQICPEEFPADEIKHFYHLRWGIETASCELKDVIGASNFHSWEREYIEMEVWARLLLYDFCSAITGHVTINCRRRKHPLQVNYSATYKACHYFLHFRNGEPRQT